MAWGNLCVCERWQPVSRVTISSASFLSLPGGPSRGHASGSCRGTPQCLRTCYCNMGERHGKTSVWLKTAGGLPDVLQDVLPVASPHRIRVLVLLDEGLHPLSKRVGELHLARSGVSALPWPVMVVPASAGIHMHGPGTASASYLKLSVKRKAMKSCMNRLLVAADMTTSA